MDKLDRQRQEQVSRVSAAGKGGHRREGADDTAYASGYDKIDFTNKKPTHTEVRKHGIKTRYVYGAK